MDMLIKGGVIVNEGKVFEGSVIVEGKTVAGIVEGTDTPRGNYDRCVDATGCFVLPGIVDTHVHFREPGLTDKADMESESRAAAYGGVTSFLDMPNTVPQTTTESELDRKLQTAARKSHVNYGFFIGATNGNIEELKSIDKHKVPGIKLFMGSSTGNMLVDNQATLGRLFSEAKLPIMAHCEDTAIIQHNMAAAKSHYGEDPGIELHPAIRSEEACYASTALAVELARRHHARLHVAHVSTARELELFGDNPDITAEAVVAHLCFCSDDYTRLGARIKCNPAIKTAQDRDAIRKALADGRIATIATDHAPHRIAEKQGGCAKALSGMPMIQFSLVTMLGLADEGILTMERLVELMCHRPARLFDMNGRGFIRKGYAADLVVVKPHSPWTLTTDLIQSKCGWSPLEGQQFNWQVRQTICNGRIIYDRGQFCTDSRGEALTFR